jgi:transposase
MRYAGIDVAAEKHALAVVDGRGEVVVRPTSLGEDAEGYERLRTTLGSPEALVVALEATGRFAEEDLARAKTDEIDALVIARMAAQKQLAATALPDAVTQQLREAVRLRERVQQEIGDKVRQLHRLVDLGFPEFRRHVRTLESMLATAILREYPTA